MREEEINYEDNQGSNLKKQRKFKNVESPSHFVEN
jgi:hypothetical protein